MTSPALEKNLKNIFARNKNKRIVVVGTTCTGKTTLVKNIPGCLDMDKLVFPKLTGEESAYVCRTPWTPEIGEIMSRLARAKAQVEPGRPVFGTIVLDCDLVVFLKISDKLLAKRTALRNVSLADARNMEKQIEEEVGGSGIETLTLLVG